MVLPCDERGNARFAKWEIDQMRLLNITANYLSDQVSDFGGVFIHRQWKRLVALGWDIHVIHAQAYLYRLLSKQARYYPYQSHRDTIQIYRPRFIKLGKFKVSSIEDYFYTRAVKHAAANLHHWKPDIIVCDWLVPTMPAAANIAANLDVPLILRARGNDVLRLKKANQQEDSLIKRYRNIGCDPCVVTCNGEELYKDVLSLNLFAPSCVINRPNGLDTSLYQRGSVIDRAIARQMFGLPEKAIVGVFAGRWEQAKGSEILAKALKVVMTEQSPNTNFVIAGPIKDTYSFGLLQNCSKVMFLGSLESEKMHHLFQAADIFVLPSYHEGTPNALLEAMSSELCCIATPVGGTKAFAKADGNMLVVEPGDHEGLIQALKRAITDENLRLRLGQAARQTIIERDYDINSVIIELDQLFRKCIQSYRNS